jgi:hypothetical protein
VHEENVRAKTFYENAGFEVLGPPREKQLKMAMRLQ